MFVSASVAAFAAPALAQEAQASAPGAGREAGQPSAETENRLSEIVVTAQKREQSAIDVPITLTAYSGATLERLDVRDFHDLSQFTPGFYVQNQSPNDAGFVMRGLTTDSGDAADEPRVSIFQDGVDISKSRGSYVELFDVQRVEVDKGPQSTLYGRSALIGAVDIIQNKASERGFDWNARVEGGDYNYGDVEGMVNIPLGDDLAVRFSGRYRRRDGYTPNLLGGAAFNSVDTGAVRMAVNWRPSAKLNTDFIFNYQRDAPTGTGFKSETFDPTNPTTGKVLGDTSPYSGAALSAPSDFVDGSKLGIHREVWGATELVDYKINQVLRLSSITAFRHFNSREVYDPDGFSYPVLTAGEDTYDNQISQELRLNYDDGHRLSGFVGVNVFADQGKYSVPMEVDERAGLALYANLLNRSYAVPTSLAVIDNAATSAAILEQAFHLPALLAQGIASNLNTHYQDVYTDGNRTEALDVYADGTYRITDQFQVSAGIRNSLERKTTSFAARNSNGASVLGMLLTDPSLANLMAAAVPGRPGLANFGVQTNPTANNGDTDYDHLTDDGLSWRLNGLYKLDPTTSVYLTYARGRRPEVLSVTGPSTPNGNAIFTKVPAETVDDVELGAKTLTLGRRLDLAGALFYYSYNNFQTTQEVGTQFITTNAGKASDYGFEGQANYSVNAYLDLFGTYTYSHGRFDSGLYKGNHFRLTPDHMVSLGLTARYPALAGVFEFTPTAVYRSKAYFDDDNSKAALMTGDLITPISFNQYQTGYALLDLRLSYQPNGRPWKLAAFMTNATNTRYLKDAGNTGQDLGLPTYIAGEPRMFGFAFSIRH